MIDLKNWDKIEFSEITEGMTVLMVRKDSARTFIYEGIVGDWDDEHKWYEMSGNWYASPDEGGEMSTEFYTKPFQFPTKPLSIIEGEARGLSGPPKRYLRLENGSWYSASNGTLAFENALRANFKNWKVIFGGVDV